MISCIQRTFQQHFRAMFAVLLAVVIISFIVTIGATPGIGRADRSAINRDFFGHNLASAADKSQLMLDAELSIELEAGFNPYDQDRTYNYALKRAAALHLADEWHLPQVSI